MKRRYPFYILIIVTVISWFGCRKDDNPKSLNDFNVTTNKTTLKLGDTATFNIYGSPSEIVFYSGESGKKYENSLKTLAAGINKLVFQTAMSQGNLTTNDSLRLLVSNNLKGYDSLSVLKATWIDITSRNKKWPATISSTYVTSDSIDVTDFNTNDSINIAFRAIGQKNPLYPQKKWQIQGFTLTNIQADGTRYQLFSAPYAGSVPTSSFAYTGWVHVSLKYNSLTGYNTWNLGSYGRSSATNITNSNGVKITAGYPLIFDPGPSVNNSDNDDWAISTKVNLKTIYPNPGVTIKNVVNNAVTGMQYYNEEDGILAKYNYIFTRPGVYNVTFVAINPTATRQTKETKTIQITVNP